VFSRTFDSSSEIENFQPPIYQKSEEQSSKISQILKNNFLTKNLSDQGLKILADAMYAKDYEGE